MKIFSVFDCKASAYLQPFFSPTAGTAVRALEKIANEDGHEFNVNGADYTLFEIGMWDEIRGFVHQLEAPVNLGTALSMQKVAATPQPQGGMLAHLAPEERRQVDELFAKAKSGEMPAHKAQGKMRAIIGGE